MTTAPSDRPPMMTDADGAPPGRPVCSKPECGRRHHSRGLCKSCYRMHRYRTDPEFRAKVLQQKARYYAGHRAQISAHNAAYMVQIRAQARAWREAHKEPGL